MKKTILFLSLFLLVFASCSAQQETEVIERTIVNPMELQSHIRAISESSLEFVVEINTITRQQGNFFFQQRQFEMPGLGSGVIIHQDEESALVLTNRHVIETANDIKIVLNDGEEYEVEEWYAHGMYDIALLIIETDDQLPIADIDDFSAVRVGDFVIAVGNPFGFQGTITFGIVSAIRETNNGNYIQTDASINPGNSGGPLINMDGEVIGINTWIASQSGENIGLGFSIPIDEVMELVEEFLEDR